MAEKENMSMEKITKGTMRGGQASMQLPRQDDGLVHKATGPRGNTSAAHYADAMDGFATGPIGKPMEQDSGR